MFFISLYVLLACGPVWSQDLADSVTLEAGSVVSHGRNVPFWLMSDRYGLIDNTPFNGWLRASFYKNPRTGRNLDYDYGLDIYSLYSDRASIILHQAYAGVRAGFFEFEAGKREEVYGNQDSLLSSGGLLWSGNAPTIPEITFRTNGYIPVPFTAKYLYVKGGISHGWFSEDPFSEHVWLHHKYIYFKTTSRFPVILSAGLHHFVQWGGVSRDTLIGHLPSGLEAFRDIFFARSGSADSPSNERLNALGNHLGSYNVRVDFRIGKTHTGIYWQSLFEDNSGRKLMNKKDGLWGIAFRYAHSGPWPSALVLEYINTTDQSGWIIDHPNPNTFPRGADNYFNNSIYRAGWSAEGRTIGTPLITSPLYGVSSHGEYFRNNRLRAYHIGVSGKMAGAGIGYRLFFSHSNNYGTYAYPFTETRLLNAMLFEIYLDQIEHSLYGITFTAAADRGDFLGNNTGFQIILRRKLR